MRCTNIENINNLIKKYDFYFKKDLGQNYLVDDNIVKKIVDSLNIKPTDTVVEVGPGVGSLTEYISKKAKKVYAIEIDSIAVKMLEEMLFDIKNLEVINKDFLKIDLNELLKGETGDIKFISNLPYYITSSVIMKVLESEVKVKDMVVMMQKEVALRINAKISTKDYSVFTLMTDYYAKKEVLFNVSKNVFYPKPKVDSSVVRFTPLDKKKIEVKDEKMLFKVIKASFQNRRKIILNSLSNGLSIEKEKISLCLENLGIKSNLRAENITLEEFGRISDEIINLK